MDPIGSFSGVASGLQWRDLVDAVMNVERLPVDRLEAKIDSTNARVAAFQTFRSLLSKLDTTAKSFRDGSALRSVSTTTAGTASDGGAILSASAAAGTAPGSYGVEVLALAGAEKLGGSRFADETASLGVTGEFFLNGVKITAEADDTLLDIRDKINEANGGDNATNVTASILSLGTGVRRLLLSSDLSGADGIDLVDGQDGVLEQLGFIDVTTSIKHTTSSGGESDGFSDSTSTIASLLGLTGTVGSQDVTIGGQTVSIDLDNDSLTDIAAAINGLTGVSATVESLELDDGSTEYYLDIGGTTSFVDSGNALELLGVVERGRSSVVQEIQGDVLTDGDGTTAATGSSLLANLWSGGGASGIQAGDTFTISGTRGDGTAVSLTYTVVGGTDTVQDVLDHLNNATDGYGAGSRTATASVDADGRLMLTDSDAGDSQMSLSIVAHNEGGGTLDFGDFAVDQLGIDRQIVDGTDALLRVDGATVSRSSNMVSDLIEGVTLNLITAEAGSVANVVVARSAAAAVANAQSFVDTYNEVVGFIKEQLVAEVDSPEKPPLYGDSALRQTRRSLVNALLTEVAGAASDLAMINAVGIELDQTGKLTLDSGDFKDAFNNRFNDLERLFTERGTTTNSAVEFISSAGTAQSGTYDVEITVVAAQASIQGSGFSGTYADDGNADTLSVADTTTEFVAEVQMSNGMTTQEIVDALNTEFTTAKQQRLESANVMYSDAGATTEITAGTSFSSLYAADTTAAGVTAYDTITYSGTRASGTAFAGVYTIDDPATQTVGDLIAELQDYFGTSSTVSVENGQIVVEDESGGSSSTSLSLTANNEGSGSLDLGTVDVITDGRGTMAITATAVGNEISITSEAYGSSSGFEITYTAGGADGTAQLGMAADTYAGVDVAGTIGGQSATGSGKQLVGDEGSDVAGLHLRFDGTEIGAAGQVSLTVGTGATIERMLDQLLDVGTGLLDVRDRQAADSVLRYENRIDFLEGRLELRRMAMIQQFTRMEMILGTLQAQSQTLGSQIAGLLGQSGRRN